MGRIRGHFTSCLIDFHCFLYTETIQISFRHYINDTLLLFIPYWLKCHILIIDCSFHNVTSTIVKAPPPIFFRWGVCFAIVNRKSQLFPKRSVRFWQILSILIGSFSIGKSDNLGIFWRLFAAYLQLLRMQHNYCRCSGPRLTSVI